MLSILLYFYTLNASTLSILLYFECFYTFNTSVLSMLLCFYTSILSILSILQYSYTFNTPILWGVVNFARETIDHHFRALRKLQVMIKWLAQRMEHFGGKKKRELAQNWGDNDFPYNHYNDIPNEYNTTLEAEPWVRYASPLTSAS